MVNSAMNKIWNSKGSAITLSGVTFIIEGVRAKYGTSLQLSLSGVPAGEATNLLDVDASNAVEIGESIS